MSCRFQKTERPGLYIMVGLMFLASCNGPYRNDIEKLELDVRDLKTQINQIHHQIVVKQNFKVEQPILEKPSDK